MSDVILFPVCSPVKEEKKEIFYENFTIDDQDNEIDGYWPVYEKHLENPILSYHQAAYLSMLERLSTKYGWTQKQNDFFTKRLKCSDSTIENYNNHLVKNNLIWKKTQPLGNKKGSLREIVTIPSAALYYAVQRNSGYFNKAKEVHDEFIVKIKGYKKANSPVIEVDFSKDFIPPNQKIESEKRTPKSQVLSMNHSAPPNFGDVITPPTVGPVLNTTYINIHKHNNNNMEESLFSSKNDLRTQIIEAGKSPEEAILGIRWLELKSDEDRKKLDSEFKSVLSALNKGYAKQEVDEYDSKKLEEEKKKIKEKEEQQQKIEANKALSNRNVKFAVAINNSFKSFKALKIMYDNKTFRIVHECLPEKQDEDGMTYRILPNGEKYYGKPSLFISFDKPYENNYQESIKFFKSVMNIEEKDFKNILNQGIQYANH